MFFFILFNSWYNPVCFFFVILESSLKLKIMLKINPNAWTSTQFHQMSRPITQTYVKITLDTVFYGILGLESILNQFSMLEPVL